MFTKLEQFLPVDPFAGAAPSWHSQTEQQAAAKSKRSKDDDDDDDDDDEDGDEDDDEDDDDDDDEDDDDDLSDLDEEELRAELRKTRNSLSKASGSSAVKRKRITKLKAELAEARKGKPAAKPAAKPSTKAAAGDDAEPVDVDAIRSTVETEVTAKANARIVKAEARGALKAAGLASGQVGRLVGMLKLDDIDVDDEGEVDEDALDEAIEALKKEWPQLFGKPAPRKRASVAGDADTEGKGRGSRKPPTATQLQVAAALGKKVR